MPLRVFLAGHFVAMVTNIVTKMITKCSPVIGQFFDTMTVASTDRVVIMTRIKILVSGSAEVLRHLKLESAMKFIFSRVLLLPLEWFSIECRIPKPECLL